jgi:hypothetical protein
MELILWALDCFGGDLFALFCLSLGLLFNLLEFDSTGLSFLGLGVDLFWVLAAVIPLE